MVRFGGRAGHEAPACGILASIWLVLLSLAALRAAAADLQERTTRTYNSYAEEITHSFLERARGGAAPLSDALPGSARIPRDGEAIIRPGGEDGIIVVPGGLLHHWMGTSFIAGATLEEALDVLYGARSLSHGLQAGRGLEAARP